MKVANIRDSRRLDVRMRSNHIAVVRMPLRKQQVRNRLIRRVIRTPLTLPPLIAHHIPLILQQLAIQPFHQEAHAIALKPQPQLKLIRRQRLKIVRAVKVCRSIDVRRARALARS